LDHLHSNPKSNNINNVQPVKGENLAENSVNLGLPMPNLGSMNSLQPDEMKQFSILYNKIIQDPNLKQQLLGMSSNTNDQIDRNLKNKNKNQDLN